MKNLFTLIKKELDYYFNNPLGYIVAIIFSVFVNFLFVKDLFIRDNSTLRPFFDLFPWLGLIFIPALGMRIFSEEKKVNTIEILLTLPVSESSIIFAKWCSIIIYSLITLTLTLSIPIGLTIISRVEFLETVTNYLGVLFLFSFYGSIIVFFSSQTKNQIVAFLCSALVIFIFIILSGDFLATVIPDYLQRNLNYLSPIYHFYNFEKGIIDMRAIIYFISASAVFIFSTIISLEKRD